MSRRTGWGVPRLTVRVGLLFVRILYFVPRVWVARTLRCHTGHIFDTMIVVRCKEDVSYVQMHVHFPAVFHRGSTVGDMPIGTQAWKNGRQI